LIANEELTAAVQAEAPEAFEFLLGLVSRASLRGEEGPAQDFAMQALDDLGFSTSKIDVPDSIVDDPLAQVENEHETKPKRMNSVPQRGCRR
jgi:acetylornithine deacetylase/succinyl-diaminopimelate desuccinylase-like protein